MTSLTTAKLVPTEGLAQQPEDQRFFRQPKTWLMLLILILLSNKDGFISQQLSPGHLLATAGRDQQDNSGISLVLTIITWSISVFLMARSRRSIFRQMLTQKAVLAFPLLALLSTLWTADPVFTLRRALQLFLACCFGWFFAEAFTIKQQMKLFLTVGVVLGLLSIPWALFLPQYGLDYRGEWKGVFTQKNELGTRMFFFFSCLPFTQFRSSKKILQVGLQALLPLALILLSRSQESLVSAAIAITFRMFGPFVARTRKEQLPALIYGLGFVFLVCVLGYDLILTLLQRDATLSGRTEEWSVLMYYARRHFWLGYGYQAFWNGSAESLLAIHAIKGSIHGADSGYLDTMLQFGIAGIMLWVNLAVVSLGKVLSALRQPQLPISVYWYCSMLLSIFVLTFVWSNVLAPGSFAMVILAFSSARLGISLSPEHERHQWQSSHVALTQG